MTSAAQQTAFEGSSPSSRPPSRATLRPQSPSQSPFEADGPIRCYDERDPFFALTNSAPYEVQHDGKEYPTAEHLFHAYKFHEDNSHMAEVVRRQPTPQTAREISLLLRPNWRNDWGDVADKCMDAVIEAKFAQHPHLRGLLLSSDTRELVFEEQARGRGDAITTTGEEGGWLGQALTRLRDQLRTKDPEAYSQEPEPADASSNWDRCSSVIDFDRASCLTYWTAAETLSETLPPIYFYDEEEPYYEFTNLSPHPVEFGGKVYANADSLFQYFDTPPTPVASAFSDPELRATWKNESGLSSRQGDTRARLYRHCMDAILEAKFLQHQELYQLLLSTGNSELVYAHPTDHFWGYSEYMSGLNELGKALMRLREKLKAQHSAGQDSERPYCEEDIAQQSADDLSERTSDYTDFEDLSSVNGCPSPIDRPPSAVLVPPREHPASPPRVRKITIQGRFGGRTCPHARHCPRYHPLHLAINLRLTILRLQDPLTPLNKFYLS
ncbi:NADAR family protein [Phanerochaete sordida]|uniref:NADAR family protein n=1 Tax=Phanerochaete sordida TaxID=48140 RepID=A0A9P3G3W7_9APHY|nr:NADAR family protein [Phanerochaete sordida]